MGKGSGKPKAQEKNLQKVERARRKFEAVQEEYVLVREHGKQQLEKAQLEAERALTKVNERLEKRAEALSRAESRALSNGSIHTKEAIVHPDNNGVGTPTSPDEAADLVAELQADHAGPASEPSVVLPAGD